ncbi:MAG: transglycosylase SLT domain-containing protein [Nitrospiraceae bacterium]|nr:transglycosylase SLT domain-containing protein [Nitrospiraceae bacterium]
MKRAKELSLAVFLPVLFLVLLPVFSYAQETAVNSETSWIDFASLENHEISVDVPEVMAPENDAAAGAQIEAADTGVAPAPADSEQAPAAGQPSLITSYESNATASKAVERSIGLFSTTIKERFSLWLSRSGQYLDMMKEILRKKNVPEDIVFLSLIESGFNPNAYSIARAAGPWQFIASTARRYGLAINWWKDERRDPVKSTEAAADYLKDLYGMFGSWNLAMAAYNAGEGKILKAIKRSKADTYWDLLGTQHIKRETKEYVPRFIAAGLIATNPKDFGFEDIAYHEPLSYDEVMLDAPVDLSVAAECAGTDVQELKKLNPELRRWCTPPDVQQYVLRVPKGTKDEFQEKLSQVPEGERFTIGHYTVRQGDTFKKIARKTGVPVPVILSLNSMEKIMPLKSGSSLYLPPKGLFVADREDSSIVRKVSYKKHRVLRKASGSRHRRIKKATSHHGKVASRHHKNSLVAAR